jgi:hypothetical protein
VGILFRAFRFQPGQIGFVSHDSTPKLASFCILDARPTPPGASSHPPPPGIGFVSHDSPLRRACPRPDPGQGVPARLLFQSAIRNHPAAILSPRPGNWLCSTHLMLALRPRGLVPPAPAGNWLRFPHFTSRPSHAPHACRLCPYTPVYPSLALFCKIGHPEFIALEPTARLVVEPGPLPGVPRTPTCRWPQSVKLPPRRGGILLGADGPEYRVPTARMSLRGLTRSGTSAEGDEAISTVGGGLTLCRGQPVGEGRSLRSADRRDFPFTCSCQTLRIHASQTTIQ